MTLYAIPLAVSHPELLIIFPVTMAAIVVGWGAWMCCYYCPPETPNEEILERVVVDSNIPSVVQGIVDGFSESNF